MESYLLQEKDILGTPIILDEMKVYPVWSDSLGAKSLSVFIESPDIRVFIDPGAAIMQRSFPLEKEKRVKLREHARKVVAGIAAKADVIIITHYHHDHYLYFREFFDIYRGKHLIVKNPNKRINLSQYKRAWGFLKNLHDVMNAEGDFYLRKKNPDGPPWARNRVMQEFNGASGKLQFGDGRVWSFRNTTIKVLSPVPHGVEGTPLGWVTPVVIRHGRVKMFFSSDISGPVEPRVAELMASIKADLYFIDGPPFYLKRVSDELKNRAIMNLEWFMEEVDAEVYIDHHAMRDMQFAKKFSRKNWKCFSAHYGLPPLVQSLSSGSC